MARVNAKPEVFNQAVDFNNRGLQELRDNNFVKAENLFARACKLVPGEKGFWNNRLLASRRIKGNGARSVEIAKRVMALDRSNSQAAYIAGLILLNEMQRPQEAIPFFYYALERSPEDVTIAVALATAFEKAGFKESAFEVLKKYAYKSSDDPYPYYMLGLQYLEREDFEPAIRAFDSARKIDNNSGYAHEAWVRAKYYAGQLEGLAPVCKEVLKRFPNVMNRQSLERILFSLEPQDFRLEEKIKARITDVEAIERLDFLVNPIPDIPGHQDAKLVAAEIVNGFGTARAQVVAREADGRLRISVPKEQIQREFVLKLVHRITTKPLTGFGIKEHLNNRETGGKVEKSEKYCLNDQLLQLMADRIERQPGNYVQMATKAVAAGLKYHENYEDNSVSWALQNPDNCDCTEFSRLLVALCLLKGYKARMITGYLVKPELMGQETAIGHAWCEVFFPDRGWISIDPTLQSTMQWAYFGNLLSDQILFGVALDNTSRISIDYTSTRSELQVRLSSSFLLSDW
ncbi:MAG: hypothetical protein Kow0029_29660 [Candidatus Rifleibacteriota bacterium]